ncbi:MAG: acyclic terpene utilization AtuA family protein, partial [Deltaproteobacteria bacterium]
MNIIYRILSTCAGIGYGFPEESFREAMKLKLDIIAADAGSIDPGPYYLGTGTSYAERAMLKKDFSMMLRGALEQNCPLVIGSCGLAGDTPNLMFLVNIAEEVFRELNVASLKVALIDGHVPDELLIGYLHDLMPLGRMASPSEKDVVASKKVAQMGIHPFITALDEGARVILAGRSCDVAIFAADPIRRGLDPALAYHAGHILECGAIACDPGSASDCLLAEYTDEGTVIFTPPNPTRKATTYSIAAHSLYEEDHPSLQFYPEGVLSLGSSRYFEASERSAGISGSSFFKKPMTIKIEGSAKAGERYVSVLFCRGTDGIDEEYRVYGKNGVEASPAENTENEIGLLIRATSDNEEAARNLLTIWKGLLLHFGYEGRVSTAGNLAFPLSPSQITYQGTDGRYVSFVIAGTRDPFFQANLTRIQEQIRNQVQRDYPGAVAGGEVDIIVGNRENPFVFVETVAPTRNEALERHRIQVGNLKAF